MEAAARPPVAWKSVALPAEHGGWGFLGEPVVLGLVLAPAAAGVCLAAAALAAFLGRHPLRIWLLDRRRGASLARTTLAVRVAMGYAVVALLLLAAAAALAARPFWPPLAAAAPLALVALAFDALGRNREALPEIAGAVALGASAAAVALAGAAPPAVAWMAWSLLALRAVTSILYVRARIRLDRDRSAGPGFVLLGHAVALAAVAWLAHLDRAPWLAGCAFVFLLARAAWGLSPLRRRVRPQTLGFQELGFGLLTLVLVAAGFRLGL
jgi:hypothetical protein